MNFNEDFSVINPGCGCGRFAVPTETYHRWLRTHEDWHCPCCTRTFQNLAKHMASEHPDFGKEKTVKALRESYGYISQYETGKPVKDWAKNKITNWLEGEMK